MKNIDFYFDFTSPYAYLAHCRLPALAQKYGYEVTYKPIDLKAAKLAAGNTGPATVQMPVKLRYIMADIGRWVQKYNAPFQVNREASFDSEKANKGALYAIQKGQAGEYVSKLWHGSYGSGGSMGSDDFLRDIAQQMGWSADEFLAFCQSEEAASLYSEANEKAQGLGVFGVPTMIVDGQMWWGNDRLDLLEEYLAAH